MTSNIVSHNYLPDRKNNNARVTIESLEYYIPLFHRSDKGVIALEKGSFKTVKEKNEAINLAGMREFVVDRIADLYGPLFTREINKLIKGSYLPSNHGLFDILYYAGINGLIKGLRHFSVDKINVSSTNYLGQWFVTYARKELLSIEAPFGVAPSRFQKYKKISAVRKKLSEEFTRYATNDEVFDYFQSGKADVKTLNGPVKKSSGLSVANQNITLDLIAEQENFEQNLSNVVLLDPVDSYGENIMVSDSFEENIFEETFFGSFVKSYNFRLDAVSVLLSDLNYKNIDQVYLNALDYISAKDYKAISNKWKDLMRDKNGPFYSFIIENEDHLFNDIDIFSLKNSIEKSSFINSNRYLSLFVNNRVEKL